VAFTLISESPMQPPQHADQPAGVGAVDALISQTHELRGRVDAVRREALPGAGDDPLSRWQRALCDLAVRHLRDLGDQLGQLRAEIAPQQGHARGWTGAAARRPTAREQAEAAGAGRAGRGEWNLVTDEVVWSPELYEIFGRDRAEGPLPLDELHAWLFAEDQTPVAALVTACLVDGKPIDTEFRIVRPDGCVRTVHMVGEPVLDHDGGTLSMWAVVRDVSELRRSQRAVRESHESLQRSRQVAADERRLAVELQEAVLPPWRGPLRFPEQGPQAMDLVARHLPATTGAPVGGGWYDALELPDGSTLLTVGDMPGHGVCATSGMAMVLGALRGMAMAGAEPGPMMRWLNQLLDLSAQAPLSSALCCRYDPAARTLTWAQAGHPSPVLFRDGTARALEPPEGALLGAVADARYGQRCDELAPGDMLLLHTEGLVPRERDGMARVRRVLDLAPRVAAARDAQECVRVVMEEFGFSDRGEHACVLAARIC
jgi:PAS domain S-box-containing protein